MIRIWLAVVVLSASFTSARGEGVEDWLAVPHTSDLVAAARGNRIAFVMNRRGARNVFVADAPDYRPRQLTKYTKDDGKLITGLALSPDGRTAVFAYGNAGSPTGGAVNPTADVAGGSESLYAVDVKAGTSQVLGDAVEGTCGNPTGCTRIAVSSDNVHVAIAGQRGLRIATLGAARPLTVEVRGGAGNPAWSPDGKTLAFTIYRGGRSLIALYKVGEPSLRYVAPAFDDDDNPRWSRDGRQLAFTRSTGPTEGAAMLPEPTAPWAIWVADAATLAGREVWSSGGDSEPDLAPPGGFGFGAGNQLHFVSEHDGWQHLYALDLDHPGAARLLTPGAFEVTDVVSDGTALTYTSNQGDLDRRHVWQVALAGGAPRQLTRGAGVETDVVVTGDGKLFCLAATAAQPSMVTPVGDQGLGAALTAGELASAPARGFQAPATVTYKSADGVTVHAQLLVPPTPGRHPAVVFLHGGPIRQVFPSFHPMAYYQDAYVFTQYLASRGFVVLSINYRGGTGYGRAFRKPKGLGIRGATEYQDVRAAGAYLRGLASVDGKRIGLWGGSYGGYLTALGLARDSELFAAGVDYAGVTDWWTLQGGGDRNAPDFAEARKVAAGTSPLAALAKWRSPVLVIHGDDDLNVALSQSIALVRALERRGGVHVEQLVLPDQTHFMQPFSAWVRMYGATIEFLERQLKK